MYDLTNKKFDRLTAMKYIKSSKWLCKCECGNFKVVGTAQLINRTTRSCGCLRDESIGNRVRTHGRSDTPEHVLWRAIFQRCYNKNNKKYNDYGGRGIKVCKKWHNFAEFFKDMGERPSKGMTLERKDNNKGYSPENCIWTTQKRQARNRRSNHIETYNGETHCLKEWCEILRLKYRTVLSRLRLGWSFVRAITTPTKKYEI